MGTQQAFAKPNMEDSRVDTDLTPHSSAAAEVCALLEDVETTPKIWKKSTQAHENF